MIYFLADAHLGSRLNKDPLSHELKLVRWLDMVKKDATCIYLLGDIFDFWFEYRTVVPKGFVRLLGKLAEITDAGIEVHFLSAIMICGLLVIWSKKSDCGYIVNHLLLNTMASGSL